MNTFSAVLLGIVQGITEFLPVSSSGHLVIVESLLPGFSQPGVLFDITLHGGTLLAVLIYFRKRLIKLTLVDIKLLIIGTIPAVVIGALFSDLLESTFGSILWVGIELIVTGIANFLIDRAKTKRTQITNSDGLIIGIAQAIAIIPGISRSGATIFAGVRRDIDRQKVAEYSFLLSIPAIAGAIFLQVIKYGMDESIDWGLYSIGFITSFIFGLIGIKLLFEVLVAKNFKIFGVYCIVLGILVILLQGW